MRSSTSALLVVLVLLLQPETAFGWGGGTGSYGTTHDVTSSAYGAVCDGTTDDTVAIRDAFAALGTGDTLLFPRDATCIISEPFVLSHLSEVTIVGQGATLRASHDMPGAPRISGRRARYPILDFRLASDLSIQDLTIDANASEREAEAVLNGEPARDRVHGGSSSLMFYGVSGLGLYNVEVIDSWHDGVYFDGMEVAWYDPVRRERVVQYRHTTDVHAGGLRVVTAGRNTLTIGDCIDCRFEFAFLSGATAGGFDIEPYHADQVVADVSLVRSVVHRTGRQCIHATNGYLDDAAVIESLSFYRNTISQCGMLESGGAGTAFVLGDVLSAEITNNTIVAVDLSARACGAPARSLIDLHLSRNVSITDNIIERITLDAAASSIVYFWNDTGVSGYAGNQGTNQVGGNVIRNLSWVGDARTRMWCWVADTSAYKALVNANVMYNTVEGVTQRGCR